MNTTIHMMLMYGSSCKVAVATVCGSSHLLAWLWQLLASQPRLPRLQKHPTQLLLLLPLLAPGRVRVSASSPR
jgi:hypothetical protein